MTSNKKVLIIRFSSFGDIIQAMNVLEGWIHGKPIIHWLTHEHYAHFLEISNRVDKIWNFKRKEGLFELLREITKENYDYIYDAHSSLRSFIIYNCLKILNRKAVFIRRKKEYFKRFFLFKLRINLFEKPFRGIHSFRQPLVQKKLISPRPIYQKWTFPKDDQVTLESLEKKILLAPSATWSLKRWPVEHWKKLVQLLSDRELIIVGGKEDNFCHQIALMGTNVEDLTGKLTFSQSCFLISKVGLVISADTGMIHVADLFGTKGIALIGPTAFGFPSGEQIKIMDVPLSCRPCTKDGRGSCSQTVYKKCLVDISPQAVNEMVRRRISV